MSGTTLQVVFLLLLQCTQGVSRAALFCILWTLLERVEEEEVVDIYRTVRYARCSTPAAVANLVSGGAGELGRRSTERYRLARSLT